MQKIKADREAKKAEYKAEKAEAKAEKTKEEKQKTDTEFKSFTQKLRAEGIINADFVDEHKENKVEKEAHKIKEDIKKDIQKHEDKKEAKNAAKKVEKSTESSNDGKSFTQKLREQGLINANEDIKEVSNIQEEPKTGKDIPQPDDIAIVADSTETKIEKMEKQNPTKSETSGKKKTFIESLRDEGML